MGDLVNHSLKASPIKAAVLAISPKSPAAASPRPVRFRLPEHLRDIAGQIESESPKGPPRKRPAAASVDFFEDLFMPAAAKEGEPAAPDDEPKAAAAAKAEEIPKAAAAAKAEEIPKAEERKAEEIPKAAKTAVKAVIKPSSTASSRAKGSGQVQKISARAVKNWQAPQEVKEAKNLEDVFRFFAGQVFKGDLTNGASLLGITLAGALDQKLDIKESLALCRELCDLKPAVGGDALRIKVEHRKTTGLSFNIKYESDGSVAQLGSSYLRRVVEHGDAEYLVQHALGWRAFLLSLVWMPVESKDAVKAFTDSTKEYLDFFVNDEPAAKRAKAGTPDDSDKCPKGDSDKEVEVLPTVDAADDQQ